MKATHASICESSMNSFGLCACWMLPGPQTTDGMPASWKEARFGAVGDGFGVIAAGELLRQDFGRDSRRVATSGGT